MWAMIGAMLIIFAFLVFVGSIITVFTGHFEGIVGIILGIIFFIFGKNLWDNDKGNL